MILSAFSSPGLLLDIHFFNMATFFCMSQSVPCTVYETMNVHEQTKKQDYIRLPLVYSHLGPNWYKRMHNQIGTD